MPALNLSRLAPLAAITAALAFVPAFAPSSIESLSPTSAFACNPSAGDVCEEPIPPQCPDCPPDDKPDGCGDLGHSPVNWNMCNWHVTAPAGNDWEPSTKPSTPRRLSTVSMKIRQPGK